MNTAMCSAKCVVLICEEALENLVGRDIIESGAKGYTVTTVRGRGNRGVRDAQWNLSSNVRFEILCENDTAIRIVQAVENKYALNFGLIVYILEADTSSGLRD